MPSQTDYALLDDPAELAEITRELPLAADGARRLETVLTIDGVHCAACVVNIEASLRDQVESVSVNAATRRARLVFRPDAQPLSSLFGAIERLGYQPRPVSRGAVSLAESAGRRTSLWRMLVAVLCMMQVMMYALPRYSAAPGEMPDDIVRLLTWAEWALTLPVMLFAAGPFFAGAWRDLRARRIGMDVPVALGIAVTFLASSASASTGTGEVWFDSVSMFVAFLLVGRWLEAAARERALAGVGDLLARLPQTVERLDEQGLSQPVSVRQLAAGDRVRVGAGQAIPADGRVDQGRSHADESLLTGESRPIPKAPGDSLAAGSLNLDGPLIMVVERAARHSRMQEIADLIDAASARKPRLAQLADRWAGPFLIAVLLLAAISAAAWWFIEPSRALWVAASVLVVACPCALSLATPTALLAAAGQLARNGLLARSPQAIESLAQADTFVFDKTGTLTIDRMAVSSVEVLPANDHIGPDPWRPPHSLSTPEGSAARLPSLTSQDALRLAAAMEAGSLHPIAAALRRAADAIDAAPDAPSDGQTGFTLEDIREVAGSGISATLRLHGDTLPARLGKPAFAGLSDASDSGVILALAGQPVARFTIAESLRPDASTTLAALRADGVHIELLSGDAPARVASLAQQVGISDWRAQASPQDKLDHIVHLQQSGRRVAMVGDGINDAPVLAQAQISVAFATGAALAQHQADLLILGEGLSGLAHARRLSRRAMRIVAQNLAFAATYNAVCIPLAVAGLLPAWLAGLGMAASSLVVVGNALRLSAKGRSA